MMMALCPLAMWAQRSIRSTRLEVTSALDAGASRQVLDVIAPYRASVDSVIAPVLGRSLVGMTAGRPESLLGNWAADVMVEFSDFEDGVRADLGVVNVGGLRNNMPQGVVRTGDIMLISPFQNRVAVAYLRGEDLLALMRDIAAVHGEGVSREVRMVITPDGQLQHVLISGEEIAADRTYRVATLDYLSEGNDRMYSFRRAKRIAVSDQLARDAMMESIRRAGTLTSQIEGRITIEKEEKP